MSKDKNPEIRFIRTSELFEEWQRLHTLKRNNDAGIGTDQGLIPARDVAGDVADTRR